MTGRLYSDSTAHPYFPLVDRYALLENMMRCLLRMMFSSRAITKGKENKPIENGGMEMTYRASTAYACVAFRIMAHEGSELTEEYLDMLMGILYDFYTADEIQKIYAQNIIFDSYDAVVNDRIVKRKINE